MANQLPLAKRTQILSMLVEVCSMRSISRVLDVSINTVTKMLEDAGRACITHHGSARRLRTTFMPSRSTSTFYNFVRQHKTLRCSPAMAAGLSQTLWSMEDVVALIYAQAEPAKKCGPYKPRAMKAA